MGDIGLYVTCGSRSMVGVSGGLHVEVDVVGGDAGFRLLCALAAIVCNLSFESGDNTRRALLLLLGSDGGGGGSLRPLRLLGC